MPSASEIGVGGSASRGFSGAGWRTLGRVLEIALAAVIGLAIVALLAIGVAATFGVHARIEQSGSMAPALEPGDLLFVQSIRPSDARRGEIITFTAPGQHFALTHRVVSVRREGSRVNFVTRGDANSGVERWSVPASGTIGREVLTAPVVGGIIQWLRGVPLVLAIWLTAPFVLFGLLRWIWRSR